MIISFQLTHLSPAFSCCNGHGHAPSPALTINNIKWSSLLSLSYHIFAAPAATNPLIALCKPSHPRSASLTGQSHPSSSCILEPPVMVRMGVSFAVALVDLNGQVQFHRFLRKTVKRLVPPVIWRRQLQVRNNKHFFFVPLSEKILRVCITCDWR